MDIKSWTAAELGRAAKLNPSLIGRWTRGETMPSVDNLRPVAEAIGRPLAEVLVAAGILRPDEVEVQAVVEPEKLSDEQLLAEVGRRMRAPAVMRPPTREEIAANPERFVVVDPGKKDHREPGKGRRRPS